MQRSVICLAVGLAGFGKMYVDWNRRERVKAKAWKQAIDHLGSLPMPEAFIIAYCLSRGVNSVVLQITDSAGAALVQKGIFERANGVGNRLHRRTSFRRRFGLSSGITHTSSRRQNNLNLLSRDLLNSRSKWPVTPIDRITPEQTSPPSAHRLIHRLSSTMLTEEQAKAVDAVLAGHEAYLEKLSRRVSAKGVREPHPLPAWIEKTKWYTSGLRHHFGEWARGEGSPTLGGAKQV